MELLYVWIENYKNIHHQGFNFSPKYRFEFDYEKKELSTVDKSKDCIEGFFDPDPNGDGCNIVNVTGIIGENGSGKSTFVKGVNNIIDFLLNNSKEKIFQTKFILILSGKDKKSINAYHNFEVNPPFSQKEDSIINILINLKEIILTNIDSIFLSNVFDGRTLDYKHIKDISTNKLAIRTRYKNFTNFYNDEFKRQIEFANKSEYIELKLLPFQIPNKVNFIFQKYEHTKWNWNEGKGNLQKNIKEEKHFKTLLEIFKIANKNYQDKKDLKLYMIAQIVYLLLYYK